MQCVLLAAGYATRLYPLTENMPKALLKLGDKTILEMVTDKIDEVSDVENIYIVTNEKFYKQFEKWCESYKGPKKVKVINDHTTSNDSRLGAIGDLKYFTRADSTEETVVNHLMRHLCCKSLFIWACQISLHLTHTIREFQMQFHLQVLMMFKRHIR